MSDSSGENEAVDQTEASPADHTSTPELGEGLQQVRAMQTERLAKIEAHGEDIKKLVGEAVMAGVNPALAHQLQQDVMELMSSAHDDHEAVSIDEIALALWSGLHGFSEMVSDQEGSTADHASSDASEEIDARPDPVSTDSAPVPTDSTDTSPTSDPAFQ